MLENWKRLVIGVDRTSFDFRFESFLSNLPWETFSYCVTDQPSMILSRKSVLNFKLSVLTFPRLISCLSAMLDEQWAKIVQSENMISTPIYLECNKMHLSKVCVQEFSYFMSGLEFTWTRVLASTSPHVLAWHMGRDYGDYRASELTERQVRGFVYSWFLENTEKTKAS